MIMAKDANRTPHGITLESLEYPAEVRREVSNAEIGQMIDWSEDPEIPGFFRHRFDHGKQAMVVSFSDENAAFQFKVRWG